MFRGFPVTVDKVDNSFKVKITELRERDFLTVACLPVKGILPVAEKLLQQQLFVGHRTTDNGVLFSCHFCLFELTDGIIQKKQATPPRHWVTCSGCLVR